jgi:AraC-like DNA-binding protein
MQILNFFISACSFILLLFSVHLFFAKQGNPLLNRLLALLLFTRFGQILIYLMVSTGELRYFPILQNFFTPFYFAAPACLYLYLTDFIVDRSSLRRKDWLHAIPFVLAIIHVLPWGISPAKEWEDVASQTLENKQLVVLHPAGLFPARFETILKPALVLGYLLATWYRVLTSPNIQRDTNDIKKKWVFFCLIAASAFKCISLLALLFGGTLHPFAAYPWFVALNSLGLLAIIVFVLHQPKLLYGYLFVAANGGPLAHGPESGEPSDTPALPKNNLLAEPLLGVYTEAMNELMDSGKPFLQPDFQMIHLAQKLNIPAHHCSFVLNNVMGKNFREWINSYRIDYFIAMYPLLSDRMTIEAVANQSGFKSIATFYNAFKKETGLMPTSFFAKEKNRVN